MEGNIISNEIDLNASNLKLNVFTNTKEVELYDLTYEYSSTLKKKKEKKTPIHDLSEQMDECIPYEEFSTNMKKLNDEQRLIVNDTIFKKHKFPSKSLHFHNMRCRNMKNFYIIVYHTKHVKILYKRHSKC
jgi:hypothetical protein